MIRGLYNSPVQTVYQHSILYPFSAILTLKVHLTIVTWDKAFEIVLSIVVSSRKNLKFKIFYTYLHYIINHIFFRRISLSLLNNLFSKYFLKLITNDQIPKIFRTWSLAIPWPIQNKFPGNFSKSINKSLNLANFLRLKENF